MSPHLCEDDPPDIPKPDRSCVDAHLSFCINSKLQSTPTQILPVKIMSRGHVTVAGAWSLCAYRTVEMPTRPCAYPLMTRSIRTVPASRAFTRGKGHDHRTRAPSQEIRDLHIDKLGPLLEDGGSTVHVPLLGKSQASCRRRLVLFSRPTQRRSPRVAVYLRWILGVDGRLLASRTTSSTRARATWPNTSRSSRQLSLDPMAISLTRLNAPPECVRSAHPLLEMHINLAHDLKDKIQSEAGSRT